MVQGHIVAQVELGSGAVAEDIGILAPQRGWRRAGVAPSLAGGDPVSEITAAAEREKCDLIAMSSHGHRVLNDLLRGSVASGVRHASTTPVLLVRGKPSGSAVEPAARS